MEEFEKKDFEKILKRNALEAKRWMKATDSDAARVYDRNLEAFPVTVELYGNYARIVDYSDEGLSEEEAVAIKDIVSRYLYVQMDRIILTSRKKREGREQHEKTESSLVLKVKENGLEFECELEKYVDTGLFLDMVHVRENVMAISAGMKVLNLFSYTSSFSVYAAAGNAESVTSVDLSNVYCQWSRRNLENNGFLDESKYRVLASDAGAFLESEIENGNRYDIVIFDPPAFSNSHKAEDFDVQKDYMRYIQMISRILRKNGVIFFSENLSGFEFAKNTLKSAFRISEITSEVRPLGFSSRRSSVRVWVMEKVAEMPELRMAASRRRQKGQENTMEDETERLALDAGEEKSGKEEKRDFPPRRERKARSYDSISSEDYSRRSGREETYRRNDRRGDDRRRSFDGPRRSDRDRDSRPRYRDDDDRPRFRDNDRPRFRDNDRPGYRDDERSGYSDSRRRDDRRGDDRRRSFDGPRRSERDRDFRPRFRDDDRPRHRDGYRPGYRDDDRPRYSDSRRRDDRPYEGRRRDYDDGENQTSRMYRSERAFQRDSRPRTGGDERGQYREGRKKSSPKPYGFDSFMETKERQKADFFWLKDQAYQEEDK